MKLSFTCTFDDYAAANRLHRKPAPGAGPRWTERLLFLWILLGAIILIVLTAIGTGIYSGVTNIPTAELRVDDWVIAVTTPWMMYVLIMGLLWFAFSGAMGAADRRAFRRLLLFLLAVMLVSRVLSTSINGLAPAQPPAPDPDQPGGTLSSLMPWLVIFAFIWFFAFRFLRGALRRNWEAQPHQALAQTVETTADGLRFEDAVSVRDYRWAGFTKWRENDALVLLYISDIGFHMIPKRALLTFKEVVQFRRLLQQHVKAVDVAPMGFEVEPAPAPMPVVALPPPQPRDG